VIGWEEQVNAIIPKKIKDIRDPKLNSKITIIVIDNNIILS